MSVVLFRSAYSPNTCLRACRSWSVVVVLLVLHVAMAFAQGVLSPPNLSYRRFPDRREGLRDEIKGEGALAVVSARVEVEPRDSLAQWPESFHVRFYLPAIDGRSQPAIRIRQLQSLGAYYILDNVVPGTTWARSAINYFSWESEMIRGAYEYQLPANQRTPDSMRNWLAGLGVVVDLDDEKGLQGTTVAPAIVSPSKQPAKVLNYLFTLRSTVSTTGTAAITSDRNRIVLKPQGYDLDAGSAFSLRWPVAGHEEGWYTLALDGAKASDPKLEVRFYHRPAV